MRTRIAVGLVVALVACKSRSEQDHTESNSDKATGGSLSGPGGPAMIGASGSGSGVAYGSDRPEIANRVAAADEGSLQRAGGAPTSIPDAGPDATESVPATPTPVTVDQQEIAPAPTQPLESESAAPRGRISLTAKKGLDPSTLTAEIVAAKIQSAYLPGLHRCYSNGLKADPKLAGTLSLAMTVTFDGRTQNAEARGLGADVDNCVAGVVGAWRFANPKQPKGGEATLARFEVVFGLTPE
jgi:hypothetical protein